MYYKLALTTTMYTLKTVFVWHLHTSLHVVVSGPSRKLSEALVIWFEVMFDDMTHMRVLV